MQAYRRPSLAHRSGVLTCGFVQALSDATLESIDLSFLSLIPLDLGTESARLYSFFLDQGTFDMGELTLDCDQFRTEASGVAVAVGGAGGGSSSSNATPAADDASGADLAGLGPGGLVSILRRCFEVRWNYAYDLAEGNGDASALDARLFCTNLEADGLSDVRMVSPCSHALAGIALCASTFPTF